MPSSTLTDKTNAPTPEGTSARLTIPAAYLEDVRTALIRELAFDTEMLSSNHDAVLDGTLKRSAAQADRAAAVRSLHEDMELFAQLGTEGDTELHGDPFALADILQVLARVLAERLTTAGEYAPVNMGAMLELAVETKWAAEQAIRLIPGLDERRSPQHTEAV